MPRKRYVIGQSFFNAEHAGNELASIPAFLLTLSSCFNFKYTKIHTLMMDAV